MTDKATQDAPTLPGHRPAVAGQVERSVRHQFSADAFTVELVELKAVRHLYEDGHYLHRARVGRQLNYVIKRRGDIVGAICYALPMMRTGYFGLSSNQMLEFARLYLIENVGGLAVWAIAQTLRRVGADWRQRFSEAPAPQIVVSWHDTVHHHGTVYKASNFRFYKLTKPRKRGPSKYGANFAGARTYTQDDAHVKGTWVYPLSKAARVLMPNVF